MAEARQRMEMIKFNKQANKPSWKKTHNPVE
jgi:hypothetical protein